MSLRLYNTLSGREEEFKPLEDNTVRMYACGLTVYNYGHIGNFRTFVLVDVLRRFLRQSGFNLNHVMNITDVDDKIIRDSATAGLSIRDFTRKYEEAFLQDMDWLNVQRPEMIVRATEHIDDMAHFIHELEDKGFAYRTEDGSYYYRITKFPEYGKLSKKDFSGMEVGARVDVDEYEKDDARDFALWKAPKPGEAAWDTEIGSGRPGWHIECSVMAMKYLGETFDIHAGGEDLVFPHHENEIAQSEALTGKPFARFWMHCRFLLVEGEKMSKSLGNFYTLRDLMLMGHKPSSIRYLLASVPYRKQLNFTFDGLTQAANSVERLRNFKLRLETTNFAEGTNEDVQKLAQEAVAKIRSGMQDDLNTAQAQAAIFEMVRDANAALDAGTVRKGDVPALFEALGKFDEIFDVLTDNDAAKIKTVLDWAEREGLGENIKPHAREFANSATLGDAGIDALIAERQAARKSRNFARADEIRNQLADAGIILEDTKDGIRWKRK